MDEIAKATAARIRERISDLGTKALGPEYSYPSLPLCVVDAVFSIGVRYPSAQKAVESWRVAQKTLWPKNSIAAEQEQTISYFIQVTEGWSGVALAQRFFGGNRQRTSTRNGILKADAAVLFAKALHGAGIENSSDIVDAARVQRASEAVRLIPGQRSGLSFDYFLMLAGDDCYVKPDRMLCRFVAEAVGREFISPDLAREAVVAACRELVRDFPNLTPRLLDHLIWSYQRKKPRLIAGQCT